MTAEWQVLLSYDAESKHYKPINEKFDFTQIEEEAPKFRVALITLLLSVGAKRLKSHCKSTILFYIDLEAGQNPTIVLSELFSDAFENDKDFIYMLQCTVNETNYLTFTTNNSMSMYTANFDIDVDTAEILLPKVKKSK
jgi:hypothetical protein